MSIMSSVQKLDPVMPNEIGGDDNSSTGQNDSASTLVGADSQATKFIPCNKRKYDPEQHCGVTRSLTCRKNSVLLKGRSKSCDNILRKRQPQTKATFNKRISKSETSVFNELLSYKINYDFEYSFLANPNYQRTKPASTSMFFAYNENDEDEEKRIIKKIKQDLINSYDQCSTLNSCAHLKKTDEFLNPKPGENSTSGLIDESKINWTTQDLNLNISLDNGELVPDFIVDILDDLENTKPNSNISVDTEKPKDQKNDDQDDTEKPIKENNAEMETNTGMMTNASTTKGTSSRTSTKSHNKKRFIPCKYRTYDPEEHCGVQLPSMVSPCTRSLTCKIHRVALRRSVTGRSKPFDELLAMKLANKE